jgi:antitoxin Phd
MKQYKATEAKDNFGELLDDARTEAIKITRNNKDVAVVVSIQEYTRLIELEDSYFAMKAQQARSEGYIGKTKSEALLEKMLNAED